MQPPPTRTQPLPGAVAAQKRRIIKQVDHYHIYMDLVLGRG
jgi:hypothetical protein